jgi:hypothetical protein
MKILLNTTTTTTTKSLAAATTKYLLQTKRKHHTTSNQIGLWGYTLHTHGHSEPAAPTSAPRRMDDKWSENSFLLCFSYLPNHGG